MIKRELYLEKLRPFIDKPIIKVITGIRRCGKSELLKMVRQEVVERGVAEEQIVYVNFESFAWRSYATAEALYDYLDKKRGEAKGEKLYLFVDEIQEVKEWEKVINSVYADWDVDVYITGSNSRLLSSELSTYLAGRYIEIRVFPLSFKEFLFFKNGDKVLGKTEILDAFDVYLRQGGFPVAHINSYKDAEIYQLVSDIYSSVLLRDTIQRYNIRNVDMLERLVAFLFDNLGNCFSAKNIIAYLKNQQRKLDYETLYNYLQALESSFIVYKVLRYDLKGKELLQTNEKYFISDLSLIYAHRGYTPELISGMLENLVFLELMRQGYIVYVGKGANYEVDFVGIKQDKKVYVQVSYRIDSVETRDRELKPFRLINDNYPKYLVTTDYLMAGNIDGVECMHIADFLLRDI